MVRFRADFGNLLLQVLCRALYPTSKVFHGNPLTSICLLTLGAASLTLCEKTPTYHYQTGDHNRSVHFFLLCRFQLYHADTSV